MSADLDLIRTFRAEDVMVDAASQNQARAALLEHIDARATDAQGARRRRPRRRVVVLGIRADIVAIALSILVVVGVVAAFLSVGSNPAQRPAGHHVVGSKGPPVIRNFSPRTPPTLPGRMVCSAELTRPGVPPGGLFWPDVCRFQSSGGGGSPNGTFNASASKINGADEYRFLITASGLAPNTGRSVYAVWLLQAAKRNGTAGTFRLIEPQRPQLLGVIEPGVGRNHELAAEGVVPASLLGSDYQLQITLQPYRSAATPGRTVLRGFLSLPNANS